MEEHQLLPMIDRIVRQAPRSHDQLLTPVSLQDGVFTKKEYGRFSEPVTIRDYFRNNQHLHMYVKIRYIVKVRYISVKFMITMFLKRF